MQYLDAISKMTEWSLFPRQTIQYHSNPSLCPNHKCWRIRSWTVLWWHTRPSKTNTKKRCSFHHRGLECKHRKWSNRQVRPWGTKWSRAKVNRVLSRECTGHNKHPLPTTQEMTLHMDITRWPIPKSDCLYSLQPKKRIYRFTKNKRRSWLWLRSWTLYCQTQIKLKKVGKTMRPFRHELNQTT